MQAYLTVPKGSDGKNLPLIMYPHGGPWVRDTAGFDYWAQYFASRGWAVIQPNFRGSSGFGKDFEDMADNEIGKAMQEDLEDAVAWLVSEGVVDAGRVCIVGASYGGYAALQGAVKTPDLYKCAVGLNGVYDLNDLVNAKRNLASFFDWKDSWRKDDAKEISPAKHAARIKIPVLIAYGEDDRTVPADESKDMIRELKKANKDVTEVKLKDGDHYLSLEKNRIQFFRAMDKFLQKHLGLGQVPLRVTEGAANN